MSKDQGELVNAMGWLVESMDSNETHRDGKIR